MPAIKQRPAVGKREAGKHEKASRPGRLARIDFDAVLKSVMKRTAKARAYLAR